MSDPRDPRGSSADDLISMGSLSTPKLAELTKQTRKASEIRVADFDAILVAGGQSPMFTMEKATQLHRTFVEFVEAGKVAAALCHGTAILRFATLSDGTPLAKGRTVTGFANVEEDFADQAVWSLNLLPREQHVMPWRIEDALKALGANYVQAGLWRSFAVRDGNLVTGQQNFSGAGTTELCIAQGGKSGRSWCRWQPGGGWRRALRLGGRRWLLCGGRLGCVGRGSAAESKRQNCGQSEGGRKNGAHGRIPKE